ncbi:DNA-directed RNA polymerase III subunit RPC7-like [Sinocyclocheilus grahami]|uniref:DNA-directed RNA polymerase III subunit RPC7-like n=1 Tax=Sinocyclocheilus grahami TaxID=75366 RepID=A0A672LI17_SINGR|nr:PREDICTED: DNA-directed RNA polymerase III subunit RPC7-like [Sinocyclocheilus grahami]XP_016137229.1 PREDICTED: DNA-directed RNA polymerase III subunit RPC7-like [Sinocyclocheilus grahami]XP_016137239.1 PREDICTED: DNA-directed RNA polymerase III subunit RPC7-like [Sinocyclocheilus grahami]
MAGRGRGHRTFSVEIVGIGKGESLPPSSVQPTPLFPPLDQKPVPLQTGEEAEYMLALKQEFRGAMKTLPFYIRPAAPKKDVERYSDKYQKIETSDNSLEWKPDWRRFPKELRVREKRPLRDPEKSKVPKQTKQPRVNKEEIIRKLETLEQKEEEGSSDEEEGQKKKPEEEEAEGEEEYDEEEFEDETDYIMSYFDNGEEFGGDSDENIDEAVY